MYMCTYYILAQLGFCYEANLQRPTDTHAHIQIMDM